MITIRPSDEDRFDQGDLLDDCPILHIEEFNLNEPTYVKVDYGFRRVIVVTQSCDLANDKANSANVAQVFDVQALVDQKIFKPADIKGPMRSGRIWGFYFLPALVDLGLNEMIVDLRRLRTVRLDLLSTLCRSGKRRARLQTPYREHFAKHFADSFSRIGLPQPYETL